MLGTGEAKIPAIGPPTHLHGTPQHSDTAQWLQCPIMGFQWEALGQGDVDAAGAEVTELAGVGQHAAPAAPPAHASLQHPAGAIRRQGGFGWERGQEKGWSGCRRWHEPGSAPQDLTQRATHPRSLPALPELSPECQVCRLRREGSVSRDSRARAETSPDFWESEISLPVWLRGRGWRVPSARPCTVSLHPAAPPGALGGGGVRASGTAQDKVTQMTTTSPPLRRRPRPSTGSTHKGRKPSEPGGFPAWPWVPQG